MDCTWIDAAIGVIKSGAADKLIKDNVTVYRVGDKLIRVDIKED